MTTSYEGQEEHGVFPPNTHLVSALCSFLQPDGVRTLMAHGLSAGQAVSKGQTLRLYRDRVKPFWDLMPSLVMPEGPIPYMTSKIGLQQKAIELVHSSGKLMLSGHLIGRSEKGECVDAMAVPRVVYDALPLDIRHALTPLIPEMPHEEAASASIRSFMSMDKMSRSLGGIVAASFLPDMRDMQRIVPRMN